MRTQSSEVRMSLRSDDVMHLTGRRRVESSGAMRTAWRCRKPGQPTRARATSAATGSVAWANHRMPMVRVSIVLWPTILNSFAFPHRTRERNLLLAMCVGTKRSPPGPTYRSDSGK
jgi:hypothetical protein